MAGWSSTMATETSSSDWRRVHLSRLFFRNIWFDDERIFQQRTIIMTENFRRISLECAPRTELHDALGLTGCEVSVNALPAGAAVPFVHRHVKNEEVYGVLEGRGELYIDGEVVELKAGDWFRISPEGRRAIRAAADQGIRFVCIQTKAGSLEGFTNDDGVACDEKAPWL